MTELLRCLATNKYITSLTLSGNSLDNESSRAVAFALVKNSTLHSLYLDNSSTSFKSQRHITAGIVSNKTSNLRTFTGFRLGPMSVTLGFPSAMESWTNDQILNFLRGMWERESESSSSSSSNNSSTSTPENVILAAANAFSLLCTNQAFAFTVFGPAPNLVRTQEVDFESPIVTNAILVEGSENNGDNEGRGGQEEGGGERTSIFI